MIATVNTLGQPIGNPLPHWKAPAFPPHRSMTGRFCRLEPLDAHRHGGHLWVANAQDLDDSNWTYLPYGPFAGIDDYQQWLETSAASKDPQFYAIIDLATEKAVGVASYLRIEPAQGCIEVGHLSFSPLLQGKTAATEAMYLMMANAFTLGYRRYEWKCDALNAPSRRAALRLGFSFEGIFRQAVITKGRNRDTAWFSVIDREWPECQKAFKRWLDPRNFDAQGVQRQSLAALR
ncbi:MAG: GNAT family N-acetyltransferase [Hahellaceae bacterium]|nr:GNAT family N-acetyltransferase [Hahellaceae bacterium]